MWEQKPIIMRQLPASDRPRAGRRTRGSATMSLPQAKPTQSPTK